MVSTVASGDVGPHVGPSDPTMVPSVTDIGGLNRVSRRPSPPPRPTGRCGGLTMFGVTTRCVTAVAEPEDARRVFEACPDYHGVYGASSMERLPTERAILAQTGAFKEIRRPRPATSEEELINGKSLRQ